VILQYVARNLEVLYSGNTGSSCYWLRPHILTEICCDLQTNALLVSRISHECISVSLHTSFFKRSFQLITTSHTKRRRQIFRGSIAQRKYLYTLQSVSQPVELCRSIRCRSYSNFISKSPNHSTVWPERYKLNTVNSDTEGSCNVQSHVTLFKRGCVRWQQKLVSFYRPPDGKDESLVSLVAIRLQVCNNIVRPFIILKNTHIWTFVEWCNFKIPQILSHVTSYITSEWQKCSYNQKQHVAI
jgi:hypothetical protein